MTNVKNNDPWTPRVLAVLVFALLYGVVYILLDVRSDVLKDPTSAAVVGTLIGHIFGTVSTVLAYYFGSTRGSQSKDEMLFNSTPAKRNGNP